MQIAQSYEGVREHGKNKGQEVNRFIKAGSGTPGQAWCCYFGYFCVDSASKELKIKNPLFKTGSCSLLLIKSNNIYSKVNVITVAGNIYKPKVLPGDNLIFKTGTFKPTDIKKRWSGHFAISIKQLTNDLVLTIEGNTNKAGSREGDGVYSKTRNLYTKNFPCVAIIRI